MPCAQSTDEFTPSVCTCRFEDSLSSISSVITVPPSSPCPLPPNQPRHLCQDPAECILRDKAQSDLLHSYCVLSYLPPFRLAERVSEEQLRVRRLRMYFVDYFEPIEVKHATSQLHQPTRVRSSSLESRKIVRPASPPVCSNRVSKRSSETTDFPRTFSESTRHTHTFIVDTTTTTAAVPALPLDDVSVNLPHDSHYSSALHLVQPSEDPSAYGESSDVSIPIPQSDSSCSSPRATTPDRISATLAPSSPFVVLEDCFVSPKGSSLDQTSTHSTLPLDVRLNTRSLSTHHRIPVRSFSDGTFTDPSCCTSSDQPKHCISSDLQRKAKIVQCTSSRVNKHLTVCRNVVNVLITPCDDWAPMSSTEVSPPTQVATVESFTEKELCLWSSMADERSTLLHACGDQPSSCVAASEVDVSCGLFSNTLLNVSHVRCCDTRGDVDSTVHSKPPLSCRVKSRSFRDRGAYAQRGKLIRSGSPDSTQPHLRAQLLPKPKCMSAVYASLQTKSITTDKLFQQRRSSNSVSSPSHHSESELHTTESELFVHVFSVPDVLGLRVSLSDFGNPRVSAYATPGICGTRGRPSDRRFYRILQRYSGSRADMLTETQRLRGIEYGFLVLRTTTWAHMVCLVRDLDRCFPHWRLNRQLERSRSELKCGSSVSVHAATTSPV